MTGLRLPTLGTLSGLVINRGVDENRRGYRLLVCLWNQAIGLKMIPGFESS